jgi:hypothetical protein
MRMGCSVSFGPKRLNRPNKMVRLALLFALMASFCSCSQTLTAPASSSAVPAKAQDFFWQRSDLASGLDYYVVRNVSGSDHLLSSTNGDEIVDGTLGKVTLVVHSSADSISIDSIGANSIFSLPAGYSFGADSTPGTPGSLLLLLSGKLDSGASWYAGNLIGPGLGQGVPVFGRVLDRVDSLIIIPVRTGALSLFGQSLKIEYLPSIQGDTMKSPIYWIAYYSMNAGPVRIEEYSSDSIVDQAQIVSK